MRADAKQLLAETTARHQTALDEAFTALEVFVEARKELDRARAGCAAAERQCRAAGCLEHCQTHGVIEIGFFDSHRWRKLHDEARSLITGKLL